MFARTLPGGSPATFQEAYVAGVDIQRRECKVRLDSGQTVFGVRWAGDWMPAEQDTVLLTRMTNGRFIILDKLSIPLMAVKPEQGGGLNSPDEIVNYSASGATNTTNTQIPDDMRPGDKTLFSDGGALIAARRGGTAQMKATELAQVTCFPYDNMVRIVAQNYELHTRVESYYKVNMGGQTYTRTESFDSPSAAASGKPSRVTLEGDVAAAGGSGGYKVTMTYNPDGVLTNTVTENRDGSHHQQIITGGSSVDINSSTQGYAIKVNGGVGSSVVLGEDSATVKCGGSEVTLKDDSIELKIGGTLCKLSADAFEVKTTLFKVDAGAYEFA